MDLPSFIWLWRIAAWSMGLSLSAYFCLLVSGTWWLSGRIMKAPRPAWVRSLHITLGICLVSLVILLLSIGIVGTLGEYGSLGHSAHLPTGLLVVTLVGLSAWSGSRIHPNRPWARPLHWGTNAVLGLAFTAVTWTGWQVVQKYLP
ncbi:MAG: DUF4079 domain-containing protein [Leptolyngbya sp. SIO1E4]|nr:DUF4079 domain-containing protein [Leptolyngbya sp. SIO1E4]